MRPVIGSLLFPGLVMLSGCLLGTPPDSVTAPKTLDAVKASPPVAPESISMENYRAVAEALSAEMDRAERESSSSTSIEEPSAKRR